MAGLTGGGLTGGSSGGGGGGGGGGSPAEVFISSHTIDNDSSLDLEDLDTDTYYAFRLILEDIRCAPDGGALYIRVGTGETPTYLDSGYSNDVLYSRSDAVLGNDSVTAGLSLIYASGGIGNQAEEAYNGEFKIYNLAKSDRYKKAQWTGRYRTHNPIDHVIWGWGMHTSNTAITALRLVNGSGNLTSGTVRVYGIVGE